MALALALLLTDLSYYPWNEGSTWGFSGAINL